jgi:hypothetical protein
LLWYPLGTHTLTADASDVASNAASTTEDFALVATVDNLVETIAALRRSGFIDSDGVAQSLSAKAEAAMKQAHSGNQTAALHQLQALLIELRAQSGQHVTTAAADLLAADVEYVMAHLP